MFGAFEALRAQGELNWILRGTRDEGLDEVFIARQRARLEDMKRLLQRELGSIREEKGRWSEEGRYASRDPEYVRAHILAEELDTILDRRLIGRLKLVERALEKMEEGTYGVCDATGERIPKGRLEAMPEAVYIVGARQTLERERSRIVQELDDSGRRS